MLHAARISNSRRVIALWSRSKAGRFSRPLAPPFIAELGDYLPSARLGDRCKRLALVLDGLAARANSQVKCNSLGHDLNHFVLGQCRMVLLAPVFPPVSEANCREVLRTLATRLIGSAKWLSSNWRVLKRVSKIIVLN